MSAAVLDSSAAVLNTTTGSFSTAPFGTGQLCFDWDQDQRVAITEGRSRGTQARSRSAVARDTAAGNTADLEQESLSQLDFLDNELALDDDLSDELTSSMGDTSDSLAHATSFTGELSGLSRGQGEVRIGAVMIKLLKKYGITDAEIAEGLNAYAMKQRTRAAS